MLNNNKDKLQAYFYRYLVNNKFDLRYADIDISDYIKNTNCFDIKYSQITLSPSRIPNNTEKPHIGIFVYYGLPLILNSSNENMFEPHRYVMNNYKTDINYPIIGENSVDENYSVIYTNLEDYAYSSISYHDNIELARLITKYICALYDYTSDIQTNYTKTFNQSMLISSAVDTFAQRILEIYTFTKLTEGVHVFNVEGCDYDIDDVLSSINGIYNGITAFSEIKEYTDRVLEIEYNKTKMSIVTFVNTVVLPTLKNAYINFGFDNSIVKRARMLYLHLKEINTPLNIYRFQKWVNDIDIYVLDNLDKLIAENENYNLSPNTFSSIANVLKTYINKTPTLVSLLKNSIADLNITIKTEMIDKLINYCKEVFNKQVFDLYGINDITYDYSTAYIDRPHVIVIKIPGTNVLHLNPPIGQQSTVDKYIAFQPITDKINDRYVINEIVNICEYLFFSGETLQNIEMRIYNENGTLLKSLVCNITFNRICSTADSINEFKQLINSDTT
jgi:hypothetical protein